MAEFDSVASGALGRPFDEQVAFFRDKLADLVPTQTWTDMTREAHDSGFMVAGAMKADLLSDLAAAVDRAIAEGTSLDAFRKDFQAIVERHGWHDYTGSGSAAGIAWRTRTIYATNAATSYAAGREAQLRQAEFPLYVYRHNDSVMHPRIQHLAWDGLTLPADHPFWSRHSPPNGWGCRCYKVGARSAAGARRLGGKPDKQLPAGWDMIDPRTGTPPGIDKGWDYAPGASVAERISALAEKAVNWDRQLAVAFMRDLPPERRDQLAASYRSLPSVKTGLQNFAERALGERGGAAIADPEVEARRTLGLVTQEGAARISQAVPGVQVRDYELLVEPGAVRHIDRQHGDPATELPRGQRPVIASDYARLPEILDAPDSIAPGEPDNRGRQTVIFSRAIGDETYTAVMAPRPKRRQLALVTMYVRG